MIEQIIDGIWKDIDKRFYLDYEDVDTEEIGRSWRLIIRKAIAESSCSQAMLEETAVMER